ncbi:MAG: glycosyltransferase [Solirubrobacteraceae bacterium]
MSSRDELDWTPVKMVERELSEPLPDVWMRDAAGRRRYRRALCLVRLHGFPLGFVWLQTGGSGAGPSDRVGSEQLAQRIWDELGDRIVEHVRADGLRAPTALSPDGLGSERTPMCLTERDELRRLAPPATVVVATRERPESLSRCIRALLEMDYPEYEIIVVDNAPRTSATRELLRSDPFRTRVVYAREDRRGLAAAHNCGLAHARGAFVAFTDDDVIVDRNWLLELARGFRAAERVACVTGLIVPAELETPAQLVAEQIWGFNKGFSERVFDLSTDADDPFYPYAAGTFGSGANMAFDTAVLRSLGGFDIATGTGTVACGGDDLSGFFSVIASGYQLGYSPAALVRHTHPADYEALRRGAYGYGVGLTAYLTKTVLDRPVRALELGRLARHGVARACQPGAQRRNGREPSLVWPSDLVWAHRRGMVWGPVAYVRSRRRVRRQQAATSPRADADD